MTDRQFIRNVRSIVFAQDRKRFPAGDVLDREIVRQAKRLVAGGAEGDALVAGITRLRQVAQNEAVGVIAGYSPITVEAVLDSLTDTPT